jgi:uncharacterized membrane protein YccC
LKWPTLREWIFSVKTFLAAMLALYIAFAVGLSRPYWAMVAVYVVANPLSGATASKAIDRTLGTILGSVGAVVIASLFNSVPELLLFAISAWCGFFLFLALHNRTPRNYTFMLAAYTLPLILLPVLDAPQTIFDVAVARCEEIVIGILCAALLNALLFPVSIRSVLITRLQDWLENSAAVARILLGAKGDPGSVSTYGERLVTSAAAVQSLLSQLPNDNAAHEMKAIADELHTRLLLLPPLIASVMDRMHAIRLEHGQLPLDLGATIEDFEHWFTTTADPGGEISAATLRAKLAGLQAPPGQSVWSSLIWANLMTRLVHLIDLWEDCLLLRDHIVAGRSRSPFTLRYRPVLGRNRYYDRSMMAFIAASAAFATFTAGLLWMWSGWTNGANAVSFVAIASCFFGSLDRPVPLIQTMLKWAMVAFSIAFLYVFIVLPSVPDFTALMIVLVPVFLLFGAFIPRPQMSLIGLITAANFAGDLALDGRWSTDFVTFVEGGIAVALG